MTLLVSHIMQCLWEGNWHKDELEGKGLWSKNVFPNICLEGETDIQNSGYSGCRSSFELESSWIQVQDVSEWTSKKTSSSGTIQYTYFFMFV